jgi:hypothetical protein
MKNQGTRSEEEDLISSAHTEHKEVFTLCVKSFINSIESKFKSDNYKPVLPIYNLINSKKNNSDIRKDLLLYSDIIDFDSSANELQHWHSFIDIKNF